MCLINVFETFYDNKSNSTNLDFPKNFLILSDFDYTFKIIEGTAHSIVVTILQPGKLKVWLSQLM